jgi:hypothetical protein
VTSQRGDGRSTENIFVDVSEGECFALSLTEMVSAGSILEVTESRSGAVVESDRALDHERNIVCRAVSPYADARFAYRLVRQPTRTSGP